MSKVYAYSRVSTDKQSNSMDDQYKKLKSFCDRKGFQNVEYLADSDVSGGKALFKRPEGSKIKDLTRGDVLIVCKSDRLYRSFLNAINTTHELVDKGIQLYIIDFNENAISFESPMLEIMLYQTFLFSHLERRQIGERTKSGLANRRSNGLTNSPAKFGYDNVDGKEVRNEDEIKVIKRMAEFRKVQSAYETAKHLNEQGLFTKTGKEWKGQNIDKQLSRARANGLI